MRQFRGRWATAALVLLASGAAVGAEPQLGRDYTAVVPPQMTSDPQRIVVLEFFSYACPHCASFYPALAKWVASLPDDVVFERAAVVVGREPWRKPSQLFYTLQALGKAEELDGAIFNAIHREQADLFTDAGIIDWVAAHGVDRAEFTAAFNSFSIRSFVARGDQLANAHRIPSVPTLIIDGKYMVAIGDDGVFTGQLAMVDQIIAKARAEKTP
jgi:protein dithiol oxidoreductase (disulfide-forming)